MKRPVRVGIFLNRKTKASRDQVAGIFRFAGEHPDWELHLFTRPDTPDEMRQTALSLAPDGIIAGHPAIIMALRERAARRIPAVLIDYSAGDTAVADARIICDDHLIGAEAADIFLRRGFTAFAFAGIEGATGDSDAVNSVNRENGFRRALAKAGHTCASYHERLPENNWRYTETAALVRWLKALPKPCAVMAHSDLIAQSVLSAAAKARIPVPEQLALIGVDNEEIVCENSRPTISSIEPDFTGGGYLAARTLDALIRDTGDEAVRRRATYGLLRTVERMSTQNTTSAHLRVAKAQEMIRAHYVSGIRVGEIAAALGISPRMLEITFRKSLGHSVRDELLEQRLAEARRLLRRSFKPQGEIAALCGFRTLSALKALFRRRFGCSMREYRARGPQN